MVARAASVGGRIPGLWSQYAVEHVCGFGFVKRGFDLGRFDIKSRFAWFVGF